MSTVDECHDPWLIQRGPPFFGDTTGLTWLQKWSTSLAETAHWFIIVGDIRLKYPHQVWPKAQFYRKKPTLW